MPVIIVKSDDNIIKNVKKPKDCLTCILYGFFWGN